MPRKADTKKILILTGDGGESYETLYAMHRMQEAGYTAHVAALSKRRLHLVIHDFEPGWDTYIERQPGYGVEATVAVKDVKASAYDAILIIGGRAPEYLRNNAAVIKLVQDFDRQKKWIFSICHGIQVLVAAGLTAGRKLTCYEHVKLEVIGTGGEWVGQQAVRDGRYVTAQTWESHPQFYALVMPCLTQAAAESEA